ncbi:phage tail protein [Nocardia sp. CA-128927]|uniref:phage tail protein n=1 Tax=Nocardia sp. CA-128927 TaxID=3239975 RepID=UPI003D9A0B67
MITPPPDTRIVIEGPGAEKFTVAGPGMGDRGVVLADEDSGTDFDAMYETATTTIWNATAYQIGADFGGLREEKFDFSLAFHVLGTPQLPWRHADSAFRQGFSFRRDSMVRVQIGDTQRRLPVRLGAKPRVKIVGDPNIHDYGLVVVPLIGAYPRWLEDDATSTFITATDTTGGGVETGFVTVANPLPIDYEIWPRWVFQGTAGIVWTIPDFSWGSDEFDRAEIDADRKIVMPPLLAGEHIVIDTDRMARNGQANSSLDTEFYARMGGKRFVYPLPGRTPETRIPVSVTGAPIGAGIQVRCPRPWPRPWGGLD